MVPLAAEPTSVIDPDAAAEAELTVGPCDYCGQSKPLTVQGRWCDPRCSRLDRSREVAWRDTPGGWAA